MDEFAILAVITELGNSIRGLKYLNDAKDKENDELRGEIERLKTRLANAAFAAALDKATP